jgi:hypothetical protein
MRSRTMSYLLVDVELTRPPEHFAWVTGTRGEGQLEAGMAHQPAVNRGGLVGGGVVDDDMHVGVVGDVAVDEVQELAELDGTMLRGEIGDHVAGGDIERRIQVDGAVADVVMRAALGDARPQWEAGAVRSVPRACPRRAA